MSFEPNEFRRASLESWEEAATGWRRHERLIHQFAASLGHWLVEAINPQPGERVLELAAGLAEPGLLAAELVAPSGGVIISDQAEAMLEGARARAQELGVENAEFRQLNAEWIDLPIASVDAVLCRWGYMLMADPSAALSETRRVLRPGGRVALAVWDGPQANPWAALPMLELIERGILPAPNVGGGDAPRPAVGEEGWTPGMFSLSQGGQLAALIEQAGFTEVDVQALELRRRHPDFASLWESTLDLARPIHDAVLSRKPDEIAEIEAAVAERFAAFTDPGGALEIPARTLVARASA